MERARRRCDENLRRVAAEGRRARVGAGISQADVGRAIGASHARVGRFERGEVRDPPIGFVAAYCAAVGLDLAVRAYPAGDAIRDVAHARLLERFRQQLHPTLRWRTEVPLPAPGDPRSWDAMTGAADWRVGVEVETAIDDTQALDRKVSQKRRDGGVDHVILVVADTARNRRALAGAPAAFADLPLRGRVVLPALRAGRNPDGSGLVFL